MAKTNWKKKYEEQYEECNELHSELYGLEKELKALKGDLGNIYIPVRLDGDELAMTGSSGKATKNSLIILILDALIWSLQDYQQRIEEALKGEVDTEQIWSLSCMLHDTKELWWAYYEQLDTPASGVCLNDYRRVMNKPQLLKDDLEVMTLSEYIKHNQPKEEDSNEG